MFFRQHAYPLLLTGIIAALLFSGCISNEHSEIVSTGGDTPTGIAMIKMTTAGNSMFSELADHAEAEVSGDDMYTVTASLTITDTSVEGIIENIPAGKDRKITIYVYDEDDELVYKGEGQSDVVAETTVDVEIDVIRLRGDVNINGSIIDSLPIDLPVTDDLVAWYPFNGSAIDFSRYSNNGTVHGATSTDDRFGNANSAYIFDGSDDYIDVPYDASLDCEEAVSVALWAKSSIPGSEYTDQGTILQFGFGTERAYSILYNHDDDVIDLQYRCHWKDSESFDGGVNSGETIDIDWHFYAFTFDGDSIRAWADSDYLGATVAVSGDIDDLPLRIGTQSKALSRFWNGKIDDVCIFNRALTKDEIELIRTSGE